MTGGARDWSLVRRADQQYLFCRPLAGLDWLGHAFSTRTDASGAERNLGLHVGDATAAAGARERFLAGLGLDLAELVVAGQVHGTRVAAVGPAERGAGAIDYSSAVPATDGLATGTPGLVLSVYYADCAPILLVDPAERAVAAVHAGWRGAVAGIAAQAVTVMRSAFAAEPRRMLAAIGPAIGPCCYEVGPDLAEQVPARARPMVIALQPGGAPHLDLPGLNAWCLREAGVPGGNISLAGECTGCRPDLYFSHRRGAGGTGRMMALIVRCR